MIIYIGADHRGFELKNYVKIFLKELGYQFGDLGDSENNENDDYPDFAAAVAKKVSLDHENSKGILICGAANGVAITANKFLNVRAAVAMDSDQAFDSRNDNDANVLCLASDYVTPEETRKIVFTWLQTAFDGGERFRRRLNKISDIELKNIRPVNEE
ncbi:MAG: RpiB/LacA/LacB family sugar-phosphate isomerase [Patescibacteria group bacterium]